LRSVFRAPCVIETRPGALGMFTCLLDVSVGAVRHWGGQHQGAVQTPREPRHDFGRGGVHRVQG
jgi:hypothetical protein